MHVAIHHQNVSTASFEILIKSQKRKTEYESSILSVNFNGNVKRETLFRWNVFRPGQWLNGEISVGKGRCLLKEFGTQFHSHPTTGGFHPINSARFGLGLLPDLLAFNEGLLSKPLTAYSKSVVIPIWYRRCAIGTTNGKSSPKGVC